MGDGNTSFREHDVEYLQKRTKLWLEATLGEKYGDRTLADLIADGNVLYRVSKVITKEMTGASPGPQEISPKTINAYGKKSGKYLPYANVDTFLKTCRTVGLTDVELFTPPDAVEGKDIRRVCTSIRSLARKARNQLIKVPDFEDVNRPLPMPKEKVGGIKENLQQSKTSPANSKAATDPDADIKKSERVQIISRFLSATKSPEHPSSGETVSRSPSVGSASPATPSSALQASQSFSSVRSPSPSTPTPTLTKSISVVEPSPLGSNALPRSRLESSFSEQNPSSDDPSGQEKLQPSLSSGAQRVERSDSSTSSSTPSFSRKNLGSFRHAQPHFVKSPSQSKSSDLADNTPEPEDPASAPVPSSAGHEQRSGDLEKTPSNSKQPPADDQSRDMSSLSKAYRHAQPHFSFKKSSQDEDDVFSESRGLQSKASKGKLDDTDLSPKAASPPSARPNKPQSSNKIVENDPRSSPRKSEASLSPPSPSSSPRASSKGSVKLTTGSQGTAAGRTKEPLNKQHQTQPKSKGGSGFQFNSKLWLPILAGALAFLGTFLVVRKRTPSEYEVKQGDTLSKISKQVGKQSWDELVKLNPSITNPNLIYPSDRIKLPTERGFHH